MLPPTSDPSKEAAVAGCIARENFNLLYDHQLIPPEAFTVPHWRIVYRAASDILRSGEEVCVGRVSNWIAFHELDVEMQESIDSAGVLKWQKWSEKELADFSYAHLDSANSLLSCLEEIHRLHIGRQRVEVCQQMVSGEVPYEEVMRRLSDLHGRNGHLPEIISAAEMCRIRSPIPDQVVEGILHKGSKMVLGGGSKSFKTWTLLEMAICVASGIPWLGRFPTTKGRAIYLNFEIQRCFTEERVCAICSALRIPVPPNLDFWNLRGHSCAIEDLIPKIIDRLKGGDYSLVTLDPLYKLLGDRKENVTEDIAHVMNEIEKIAVNLGPAVNFGSHFSKGNQSAKEAIDRISGSGVFARDPDTILTMTEHEEPKAFTVDLILRNFPPIDSFVVRRKHPLMHVDDNLNADAIKQKPNSSKISADQVFDCLQGEMTRAEWWAVVHRKYPKPSDDTFDRRVKTLMAEQRVLHSQVDHKYSRLK